MKKVLFVMTGIATFIVGAWQGFSDLGAIAIMTIGAVIMFILKN